MANSQQERYVLEKKLGAGGMGEVWLANDTLLNRPVAIKYLKSAQDAPHDEAFLSEARMLASLNHPNVTLIYDAVFDENKNQFYLVMEYVEGKPLSDLIPRWSGPLPLEIILDVAIDILQALQYAHEKGIVHRDIKPDNAIMQKEGVKLTDFGVAGLISLLAEGTEYMAGTPAYMSPEQIQGEATDGRADLYSLGVMLFEMASGGHQPYQFSNRDEALDAHLDQAPGALRTFSPNAPLALERIVMRLLAKDPADRYPSAETVIDALRPLQARQRFSQSHLDLLDPEIKPLVGRTEQLQQMEVVWTACQEAAKPYLLVVKGEMGIGKSKLITEFLGQHVVDKGFAALVGRCDESGAPYAPFAEILATIMDKQLAESAITQEQADQLLDQIPSLARLLNISDTSAAETETDKAPPQEETAESAGLWKALSDKVAETTAEASWQTEWQFFATVLAILTELGPAVVFLENATFLDEASVALARFLIRQGQLPLLLVAAGRDTEQAMPWLDAFSADEHEILTVPPLSPAAVKEHVANLIGGTAPEAAVDLITERSHGNLLQIEGITQQLLDSKELHQAEDGQWRYTPGKEVETPADAFLPQAVLSAFTRRIEKLPESSRQALALAALIEPGPEFNFDPWVTLLGGKSPQELAQGVLDEALKKRLIRQVGHQRYTFRPPDLAKALTAVLTKTHRRKIHSQIAKTLHQQQADPILVGYHYEQAGQPGEAAEYLETAGNKAISTNAVDTAIVYYNRAGALAETCSTYKALGYLYRLKGKKDDSVRALQHALALAKQAGDTADQAQILNGLSLTFWLYDDYEQAYQQAAAVLKLDDVPEREGITAQLYIGIIAWLRGQLAEAEEWCQKSLKALQKSGHKAGLARAYNRLGQIYLSQGKLAEAQTTFQHALELRQKLGNEWGQGQCLTNLGRVAAEQGDFEQASSLFQSAQQLFEKMNSRDGLMAVYANQGRAFLYQGNSDEALPLLTQALHLAMERGQRSAYVLSDIYLLIAQASLGQGKVKRARAATDDALKLVEAAGNQEHVALAQATLAQVHAAQGDSSAAEAMYQQALTLFEQIGSQIGLVRAKLSYAQFLGQQGQAAEATTMEQKARDEAGKMGLYLS
jgi:serine/threonine protein kinase/tetratricopeptide (TPR) repeat protein